MPLVLLDSFNTQIVLRIEAALLKHRAWSTSAGLLGQLLLAVAEAGAAPEEAGGGRAREARARQGAEDSVPHRFKPGSHGFRQGRQ